MAVVRPFRALRPRPELAARVASVPYDVVNTVEARELAKGNPLSFLHVVRPEIDLPDDVDPHDDAVYAQAARALQELRENGSLVEDPEPSLYAYRQVRGKHVQTGIVGTCSADEYDADLILKHEKTRPDKEDDRTRHMLALSAHPGPVFLAYRGDADIGALVAKATSGAPLYDFVAVDGVTHTVWKVQDSVRLAEAFRRVPVLYVADGHHRSAASSRARAARRAENPKHDGTEEYNFFLAVAFPSDQLDVLPYNRVVQDLAGHTPERFLQRVSETMTIVQDANPTPSGQGSFSMYLGGRWYGLAAPAASTEHPDPVARLDTAILQDTVLSPILGIDDPRTSQRIAFVGGIRGTRELERLVDERRDGVAFSLRPVSMDEVMAVADAKKVLPPKCTWFEPKLRSGLLVHPF